MYKEMFLALVQGQASGTMTLKSDDVTSVRCRLLDCWKWIANSSGGAVQSQAVVTIDFPNCIEVGNNSFGNTFNDCNLASVNLPELVYLRGGSNFQRNICTEINLPKCVSFSNHEFSYSSTLKTLRLPSVTSKSGSFFVYQCSALENVYIESMTLSQLGGASYIAQQSCNSAAVFHLKDGDYDYQGNLISNGGGYKRKCVRRSHRRSWRPSARFYAPRLWKEVA